MTDALRDKLKTLPAEPGVYFHRDANKKIIYIGKAAVLKNRVMSYFQVSKHRDQKTRLLVAEIAETDWITVGSEVEALFLESEFIKRYKPKYNVDLKDDKNFLYVKISADTFPVVSYVRRPMDDKAHYYRCASSGYAHAAQNFPLRHPCQLAESWLFAVSSRSLPGTRRRRN